MSVDPFVQAHGVSQIAVKGVAADENMPVAPASQVIYEPRNRIQNAIDTKPLEEFENVRISSSPGIPCITSSIGSIISDSISDGLAERQNV